MVPASRYPQSSYGASVSAPERVAFLRQVYLLVTGSVIVSALAATFAITFGADSATLVRDAHGGTLALPPIVALVAAHPFITMIALFGSTFAVSAVARTPGINVVALFGLGGLFGLFIAPAIYFVQARAAQGMTLSSSPVLHAFLLAVSAFLGLSGYALTTRRDFSNIGGFLTMGLFVVIGASLLNIFFGGAALSLAIASVCVLLFGGYVLYDTQRVMRSGERSPVVAALALYLDFLNLFMALLRIFGSDRR